MKIYTTGQAAKLLSVNEYTVRRRARDARQAMSERRP